MYNIYNNIQIDSFKDDFSATFPNFALQSYMVIYINYFYKHVFVPA